MLVNPTGGTIRNDKIGAGFWKAPRRSKKHDGTDFVATPGQYVLAPISGQVVRSARPYENSTEYDGVLIKGQQISIIMFYLKVDPALIGMYVQAGQAIGFAQDISKKYGSDCVPHVHLKVVEIDPTLLM